MGGATEEQRAAARKSIVETISRLVDAHAVWNRDPFCYEDRRWARQQIRNCEAELEDNLKALEGGKDD